MSPIAVLGTAMLFVNVAFAQDGADVQQCAVSPPTVHVNGLFDTSSVRLHCQCQWHTMRKSVSYFLSHAQRRGSPMSSEWSCLCQDQMYIERMNDCTYKACNKTQEDGELNLSERRASSGRCPIVLEFKIADTV